MEELEQALIEVYVKSPLPLEAKRYVLKHLFGMADLNYQLMVKDKQIAERESEGNDNRGSDKAD